MSNNQTSQIPLSVRFNDYATFDNYYVPEGSANAQIVNSLRQQACGEGEAFVYLWGADGVGLSHLLQATCAAADELGKQAQYIPLQTLVDTNPAELFEGLEQVDIICLDDLTAIAGARAWEEALFNFYNTLRAKNKRLLVAATYSPREIQITLADLRSRLQWGITYFIEPLVDEQKIAALMHRAKIRGLKLEEEVASFIVQRSARGMTALFDNLCRLDDAVLLEKRNLTIPFVKKTLGF